MRAACEQIDESLGGTTSVELTIKARGEGLKDPKVLAKIDHLQQWFEVLPGVGRALSVVDYLKELNRVLHGGDQKYFRLPDTPASNARDHQTETSISRSRQARIEHSQNICDNTITNCLSCPKLMLQDKGRDSL